MRTKAPDGETPEQRTTRLRTKGFAKQRPGCIHIRCPGCGRKTSNNPRQKYDPPRAWLAELGCPRCDQGGKDCGEEYFTESGERIDMWDEDDQPRGAPERERCGGHGWMICYCGGDLCVCGNQGEIECMGCADCKPKDDGNSCDDDAPRDAAKGEG